MKISKEKLQQIIKEELESLKKEEKMKAFGSVRKTAQDSRKAFRQRGDDAVEQADEYTNVERGIVQQINDLLEKIALQSDLDQGQIRSELMAIFKRLQRISKKLEKKQSGKK